MRITGGVHRGRRLAAPAGLTTRPTADRARQALFNILAHGGELADALVIDAFAGSGALGLEALSRGAAKAVFIDDARPALAAIAHNLEALDEGERALVIAADATRPPPAGTACSLAFLDPPYNSGLAVAALAGLAAAGWLAEDALAVVEVAAKETFTPPEGFSVDDERIYGAARLVFCRRRV